MSNISPITYNLNSVKGISQTQLSEHYKLYEGYIKQVNALDSLNKNANCFKNSNSTFSSMRSIKLGESFALNGALLHQFYFENITFPGNTPSNKMLELIRCQWISYDNFINYLKKACLSVHGWVTVCIDTLTKCLRIAGSDAHDIGSLWCTQPLIVIDVYEHAYFLDFGTNRAKYVDIILETLNWKVINSRLNNLNLF